MKLVTFEHSRTTQIGCLVDNDTNIVNLTASGLPLSMNSFLSYGIKGIHNAVNGVVAFISIIHYSGYIDLTN